MEIDNCYHVCSYLSYLLHYFCFESILNLSISVIVNNFNKASYLVRCLDSIKNQSYEEDMEIIFWDDNSTDNSLYVLYEWKISNNYKNMKIFSTSEIINSRLERCLPLGVTRWLALKQCSNKYVAILDSDDRWSKTKVKRQIKLFDDPKVKLTYTDCYFCPNGGGPEPVTFHGKYQPYDKDVFFNLLTKHNFMPASTLIFDREALLDVVGSPTHYTSGEDYDWCLKMAANYKIGYLPLPLTYYNVVSNSLTHNNRSSTKATWYEIDAAINALSYKKLNKREKNIFYRHLIILYCKLIWKQFFREKLWQHQMKAE